MISKYNIITILFVSVIYFYLHYKLNKIILAYKKSVDVRVPTYKKKRPFFSF